MRIHVITLLALLVAMPAGALAQDPATTPMQAAMNLRDAMVDGDQEAFLACFKATEAEQEMLGSIFELAQASKDLQEAVLENFGEEGAAEFGEGGGDDLFSEIAEITEDDLIVEEDGDTATITKVGEEDDDPLNLVREDGVWLISFEDEMPTGEEAEQAMMMIEAMTGIMNDTAEAAAEEGMTVEQLKQQMTSQMMDAMMMMMAAQEEGMDDGGEWEEDEEEWEVEDEDEDDGEGTGGAVLN